MTEKKMKSRFFHIIILALLFVCGDVFARELDPFEAVKDAISQNLKSPSPDDDGRVQTLNNKGAMSPKVDPTSREFVEAAAKPDMTVLEIGAGYGLVCMEALTLGAKDYTANDLDERHLKILALNVGGLDFDFLNCIKLMPGSFPQDVAVQDDTFDAILIARVLHFMKPTEVKATLDAAYKMLKPGGTIYAVMISPYMKFFVPFVEEFERRIEQGWAYPGYIENLSDNTDKELLPNLNIGDVFFFFDPQTAQRVFEESGFVVEKSRYTALSYHSYSSKLDGRENVGVVARKPEESEK